MQNIHGTMDNCKNIDLVRFDVVDNTIGTFNHFPYLIEIVFRNPAT